MIQLLAFFAHPDDEILGPGGTMAQMAQAGAHIELVCATRGEAGEIADPSLATPETLAEVREQELWCAAQALGIRQVHFLGYRDSGMAGTAENERPEAFINIPAAAVVPQLVKIMRETRPHIVITFEPFGGYGHPDHIAIHHHTLAALDAAADPTFRPDLGAAWDVPQVYYPIVPITLFEQMRAGFESYGLDTSFFDSLNDRREKGWPNDQIHVVVDVQAMVPQKMAAFKCHRTQFGPDNLFRRLPEAEMAALFAREYFAQVRPQPTPGIIRSEL